MINTDGAASPLNPELLITLAALESLSATLDPSGAASRRAIKVLREAADLQGEAGIPPDVAASVRAAADLWEASLP